MPYSNGRYNPLGKFKTDGKSDAQVRREMAADDAMDADEAAYDRGYDRKYRQQRVVGLKEYAKELPVAPVPKRAEDES